MTRDRGERGGGGWRGKVQRDRRRASAPVTGNKVLHYGGGIWRPSGVSFDFDSTEA
jgi:hypothetical protein